MSLLVAQTLKFKARKTLPFNITVQCLFSTIVFLTAPNFLALATTLENLGARWLLAKKVNFVPCITYVEKVKNSSPKKLSAYCWPTVGRQSADSRPTVGQQLDDSRPTVGQLSADCRLPPFTKIFCQQSADCWPHVGNLLAKCRLRTLVGSFRNHQIKPVSYTHLTLPTKLEV